jgi:hypothetical protein
VRSWALDVVASGTLTVAEIRNDTSATRTLARSRERLSPLPDDIGLARFLVEVPCNIIEGFVKIGFIRPDQQDDLAAIMGALRRLGRAPSISRVA